MRTCEICGDRVNVDNPNTRFKVTSWVSGPKLQSPKLRERTGGVAHGHCIENLVRGQSPDQPELFERLDGAGELDQDDPVVERALKMPTVGDMQHHALRHPEAPRLYTGDSGEFYVDTAGVAWQACDPYPTWFRREGDKLITGTPKGLVY